MLVDLPMPSIQTADIEKIMAKRNVYSNAFECCGDFVSDNYWDGFICSEIHVFLNLDAKLIGSSFFFRRLSFIASECKI